MSFISDANSLVTYLKDFTGSDNSDEIKECIFLTEMMLRTLRLPALRSDPYNTAIFTADSNGSVPIPADMVEPILFFKQGDSTTPTSGLGPWIVYDRIGDRDIITMGLIESFYLKPLNIPTTVRGSFSEVASNYRFIPALKQGDQIHFYYYKSFPLLFTMDINNAQVLNNAVLSSFPEGYIYGTLHNYYLKRKSETDAQNWRTKFDDAVKTINDQVNRGKWSGGHTKLTSAFQPRRIRRFTAK